MGTYRRTVRRTTKAHPSPTPQATPCRLWQGGLSSSGYPSRRDPGERRTVNVHRWVWSLIHGPIPAGVQILHRCDQPLCYRLDHLFAGTLDDNMADMVAKGRSARGERNGRHKFTDEQVQTIRDQHAAGVRQVDIARAFGASKQHVSELVRNIKRQA